MKVTVEARRIVNDKPEETVKKFNMTMNALYDQYSENDTFRVELGAVAAQYLYCDCLSCSVSWRRMGKCSCEAIVSYFDKEGVSTDVVRVLNGQLTSPCESIKRSERMYLLSVSWEGRDKEIELSYPQAC